MLFGKNAFRESAGTLLKFCYDFWSIISWNLSTGNMSGLLRLLITMNTTSVLGNCSSWIQTSCNGSVRISERMSKCDSDVYYEANRIEFETTSFHPTSIIKVKQYENKVCPNKHNDIWMILKKARLTKKGPAQAKWWRLRNNQINLWRIKTHWVVKAFWSKWRTEHQECDATIRTKYQIWTKCNFGSKTNSDLYFETRSRILINW